MINLRVRTEYSFKVAYGPLKKVIAAVGDAPAIGICDREGSWGHVAFEKAVKKAGKRPILGVEVAVVRELLQERVPVNWMAFLARNNAGLRELYELITESTTPEPNFYYHPRIDYKRLGGISDNVAILSGVNPVWDLLPKRKKNLFIELAPSSQSAAVPFARASKLPLIATSDNFYPLPEHRQVYEIIAGRNRDNRTTPMYILDEWEWLSFWPEHRAAIELTRELAGQCNAEIPKAKMVKFQSKKTLEQMCREAAPKRRVDLKDPVYAARLRRELDLIAEKDFADYFFVITDMLLYAKKHMLVGPARGSSCGSLVCYLLSITEIDPIPYDLLFERFIDINRKDLPDIDIDFPDDRRDMVFEYVKKKYGEECVARLGTIMRYKAKSSIDAVAIALKIPKGDTDNLKGAIIERSTGDARAAFCILDTFQDLEIGREMLRKYPHIKIAADIEAHASGTGQHAAGIVITQEPINHFCSMNKRSGAVMVDKYDAEAVQLLKIDALGLRTLSVIQDCLDQIGKTREWLLEQTPDDPEAFEVINNSRFAGLFQFEGLALQSLCQQMKVEEFEDIASLGALARPGPLNSGGASEFVKRRTGKSKTTHLHPLIESITRVSYGVVIYQEQVMQIGRVMGKLSWEDVSALRKAMSKSLGQEFFDQYWNKFKAGAIEQGIPEAEARKVWENINTMGSWSFNRSHAVAYGMVTYWCCLLKAHWPLEWATACLRNASDAEQIVKLLQELDAEGYQYEAFNRNLSEINWSVKNNKLIGGLLNLSGIGPAKAAALMECRRSGKKLTPAMEKKLTEAVTPFSHDKVFECRHRFKHILAEPAKYNIKSKITRIADITSEMQGEFMLLAKIVKYDLRDLNEPFFIQKRGGTLESGQTKFLNLHVKDDTGTMPLSIKCELYEAFGLPIVEAGAVGKWFLWKGYIRHGYKKMYVSRCQHEDVFTVPASERPEIKAQSSVVNVQKARVVNTKGAGK